MSEPAYKIRSTVDSPAAETETPAEIEGLEALSPADDDADDPFYYGWRESSEQAPDGSKRRRWMPLTYRDLLDPQEGDVIAEDTIHRKVTEGVAGILERRFRSDPTVAVWSNLKILFEVPGLTSGPAPDVSVVFGVEDRDRRRRSFRYGREPGEVRLAIEVVSKSSVRKDYQDLLEIYAPLGVAEYVAIHPLGHYPDGPFKLTGWRRDAETGQLERTPPDPEGRIPSHTTGLLFGTGADGWGLTVWDAATGERLRRPDQETALLEERAETAEERAERAERRAEQMEAARRAVEGENQALKAEIERLRAQIQDR